MSSARHISFSRCPASAPNEVTDAVRWDAEAPLGRIVLAHAAFLSAGFVPCGKPAGFHRIPRKLGLTSSTLSLTASRSSCMPTRNAAVVADAAVLRLCAHGNFLILYGYLTEDGGRPRTRWACVDQLLSRLCTFRYDYDPIDLCTGKRQALMEILLRHFHEKRSNIELGRGHYCRQQTMAVHRSNTSRCRDGAINSSSARYRWAHR